MTSWPSSKARRVLAALSRIGWTLKRQSGSHRTLSRPGWPDFVFAFHDGEEIGPRMVVENQLALNDESIVRAFARLRREGLSRHDAVHAVGSVVAEWLYDLKKEQHTPDSARAHYYAGVERLTAATWGTKQ